MAQAKITYGKDLIMDIEENIDEYIFFEFMVAYRKLIEQVGKVEDGMGTKPHATLMDYLFYKMEQEKSDYEQSKLGV
tara:strand:- start:622 stop:852 length:231 start_codon:yes stop_codon:yes gene_type:complete